MKKAEPDDVSAASDLPRATVASGVPPKAMRGGIKPSSISETRQFQAHLRILPDFLSLVNIREKVKQKVALILHHIVADRGGSP
jgi:hypothetical protein